MDNEPKEKQDKYKHFFHIGENEEVHFTGIFKFVETGEIDRHGDPVFKRKRVFRKYIRDKRYLTNE